MLFFFKDPATTEIYTLSLHDALPIFLEVEVAVQHRAARGEPRSEAGPLAPEHLGQAGVGLEQHLPGRHEHRARPLDRKSTRLNSSHANIPHAVFCLKQQL